MAMSLNCKNGGTVCGACCQQGPCARIEFVDLSNPYYSFLDSSYAKMGEISCDVFAGINGNYRITYGATASFAITYHETVSNNEYTDNDGNDCNGTFIFDGSSSMSEQNTGFQDFSSSYPLTTLGWSISKSEVYDQITIQNQPEDGSGCGATSYNPTEEEKPDYGIITGEINVSFVIGCRPGMTSSLEVWRSKGILDFGNSGTDIVGSVPNASNYLSSGSISLSVFGLTAIVPVVSTGGIGNSSGITRDATNIVSGSVSVGIQPN